MSATTRSESALVRPFAGINDADPPLDQVQLMVDADVFQPGTIVLADSALAYADFKLKLPSPSDVRRHVEKTSVPAVDCGLVVMAAATTNRVTKVFRQDYLRVGDWPIELDLRRSDADLILNDRNGFTLTVAIVLLNDLTPEPLRPNMAGTWLARREFRVRPEIDETSFSPEPMTDEIREAYSLPKGVLRYVHVNDLMGEESLSDAVRVYVDQEVLYLLLEKPSEAPAIQMQIELAIQVTETVAAAIINDLRESGGPVTTDALKTYPAAERFVENLASTLEVSVADVLEWAEHQAPVLRAHLEASFNMRDATSKALKEK